MIWFDGQVREETHVRLDLRDRGLLLADGLFETLLVMGGVAFRLGDHLERMRAGAEVLRLSVDLALVGRAVRDLARHWNGPGVVRVTVTRGVGPRGLAIPETQNPSVFASAAPWSPGLAFRPHRLCVSRIRRNDTSPLSRVKSTAYLDNVLALDEAVAAGGDDALLLSTRGNVACTSAANVFGLDGGRLFTPPLSDGVLPGITRRLLMTLAARSGLQATENSFLPADLHGADAVFTSNSVRLVSPVASLDARPLGAGRADVVRSLLEALLDLIENECGCRIPGRGDAP